MKSSVSTRRNPFPSSSKKTHCHQSLPKKNKTTTRSPVRSNQRSSPSPERQQLDKKHDGRISAIDESHLYTDYWPSSDCGSPLGSDSTSYKQYESAVREESAEVHLQSSVLAKYVERFRHGRPQSREQRQQVASASTEQQVSFWWLSPSSFHSSSTPTKTTDRNVILPEEEEDDDDAVIFSAAAQRRRDRSLSPCRGSLGGLSDTSQGELDDVEILHLQERANRHLLTSEYLNEGSIPVSSEGLGSSDFSPPVTVNEPVHRPLIPSLIKQTTVKEKSNSVHGASSQKSFIPSFSAPTRPEEDILFQWRLRRKMEQARDWTQSSQSSLGRPCSSFLPPGQSYKQPQSAEPLFLSHPQVAAPQPETNKTHNPIPPPAGPPCLPAFVLSDYSVPQPHSVPPVSPHMHLLCDVLPCPINSSHPGQSFSSRFHSPDSNLSHKKTQMKDKSVNTVPSVPPGERPSSPHVASCGSAEEDVCSNQTVPVRDENQKPEKESKRRATSSTQRKKPERSSSHRKASKKAAAVKEGGPEIPSENCPDDHKPSSSSSPLRAALGQVVSEVFFSAADSASSASRPSATPARSQSSDPNPPPAGTQNSVEVISQLLQEAEDSDENEFEDDPLLQVLRKQRKWVKEQISELDSVLTETLKEQRVT